MGSNSESLQALDVLMTEFFHNSTSNHRKREIEEQLNKFGQQKGCWKDCVFFFNNTTNELVMMYCMSVMENLINKMWLGINPQDKTEIRANLYQILTAKHKTFPPYIRKKLLKVIVDIGRLDWPMFYPNFFNNLLSLACDSDDSDTRAMGINALRIISEELAMPREDLPHQRKKELKKLLLQQVPTILHVITDTMEKEWKKCSESHLRHTTSSVTSSPLSMGTPPPSPESRSNIANLFGLFDQQDPDGLGLASNKIPVLQEKSVLLAKEALECLCHLFSWIPLSSSISPRLLNILFAYTRFGWDPFQVNGRSFSHGSTRSQILGTLSMTAVNELMAKNCIPNNFEDYLIRVFRFTFYLLKQMTKSPNPKSDLEALDEDYLEKFTEFLRLFVSVHFGRIEKNPSFPLLSFLELLFKFTFNQPTFSGYYSCLDIWELFLDYLKNKLEGKDEDTSSRIMSQYKEGLKSLVTLIITQIQFQGNPSPLEELDNETVDDNGHTEWETYIIENLEVIAKISNFIPSETMSILYPVLEHTSSVYLEIGRHVVPVHQDLYARPSDFSGSPCHNPDRQFAVTPAEHECSRIHYALRNLATVLQAFGRLSEHFIGFGSFQSCFSKALSLVEKFIMIAVFGSRIKLFELKTKMPHTLYVDVVEVHAHALATLRPFTHWLSQLYTESQQAGHSQAKLVELMQGYLNAIVPILNNNIPEKLVRPAIHTLLSVVNTVRAAFLLQSPVVDKLYSDVANGCCSKLELDSQKLIFQALSNLLLLPWPNTPDLEQRWDARQQNHTSFVSALLHDFLTLTDKIQALSDNKPLQYEAKHVIIRSLSTLEVLVTAIDGEIVKTRQLCHTSLQSSLELALQLFPIYIQYPDVTESLMSFFLASFKGLRSIIGADKTVVMIQTFMNAFTTEVLEKTIMHENSAGVRVVDIFIKILEIVINESNASFKNFTPNIIALAIYQIYPIVAQRSSPDVKESLFSLLSDVLSRKQRYFFPAPVLAAYLIGDEVGVLNHKNEFLAIMQAFGQSFLQPDITIFKQNLDALEDLNRKQKLYEKIYKLLSEENILFQFVNVLLQALIHKSHDLLQEEIYKTMWNMIRVDLLSFHSKFLLQFLHDTEGITPDQKDTLYKSFKCENDEPSFDQSMKAFVNDLCYFRLCNSSLPEGTVKF